MKKILAILIGFILIFGCPSQEAQTANSEHEGISPQSQEAGGALAYSNVSYFALYKIEEGGSVTYKNVWRHKDMMRIEISPENSESYFALYFLGNKAFSCISTGINNACYDISQASKERLVSEFHFEGLGPSAVEAESVGIGEIEGKCYITSYGKMEKRKLCFTNQGIPAYEEYPLEDDNRRTEYLVRLVLSASDSDFILPFKVSETMN